MRRVALDHARTTGYAGNARDIGLSDCPAGGRMRFDVFF
jgi:hypothetical protein